MGVGGHGDAGEGHAFHSAVINVLNAILGPGLFVAPYCFRQAGFVAGTAAIIFIVLCTERAFNMLIWTSDAIGLQNYETMARAVLGPFGFIVTAVSMCAVAFGAMVSYTVIMGDAFPAVIHYATGLEVNRVIVQLVALVCICLPLGAQRDIGVLAKTSAISIFGAVIIILAILIKGPPTAQRMDPPLWEREKATEGWLDAMRPDTLGAFGMFAFSFAAHHSIHIVRNSLAKPEQWPNVSRLTLILAILMCGGIGWVGFYAFRNCTESDVLNNLFLDDTFSNIARLMLATMMLLCFPIEMFAGRQALISTFRVMTGNSPFPPATNAEHYGVTAIIFVLATLVGVSLSEPGFAIALTGAIFATTISYILPAILYLRVKYIAIDVSRQADEWSQQVDEEEEGHMVGGGDGVAADALQDDGSDGGWADIAPPARAKAGPAKARRTLTIRAGTAGGSKKAKIIHEYAEALRTFRWEYDAVAVVLLLVGIFAGVFATYTAISSEFFTEKEVGFCCDAHKPGALTDPLCFASAAGNLSTYTVTPFDHASAPLSHSVIHPAPPMPAAGPKVAAPSIPKAAAPASAPKAAVPASTAAGATAPPPVAPAPKQASATVATTSADKPVVVAEQHHNEVVHEAE